MDSKKQQCYEAIFRYIETKIIEINPKSFHTDYEAGLRAALRTVYSNVQLKGCWLVFKILISIFGVGRPRTTITFGKKNCGIKASYKQMSVFS